MTERRPTADEYLEQAFEDAQHGGGAEDVDLVLNEPDDDIDEDEDEEEEENVELAAWLAEREDDLREQAFAAADQFADVWPPKPTG